MKTIYRFLLLLSAALCSCSETPSFNFNNPYDPDNSGISIYAPAAPGAATVTSADGQLSLSWTAVSDATAYEVWFGTSGSSGDAAKFGEDVTITGAVITSLTNGTTYYIWLKSKNSLGTSGFGEVASGIPLSIPAAPGAASVTPANGQILLLWKAVPFAAAYEVWYGTSGSSGDAAKFGEDVTVTSAAITPLTNGTTYYIWLKAKNSVGTSGFGAAVSGTPFIPSAWNYTTPLTSVIYDHAMVSNNNYIYGVGVDSSSGLIGVQYAPVNADGTAGSWTFTTSFATERRFPASVVYNGYIYVIGGLNGGTLCLNDVQYATINLDGTIGSWTATTSFPTARYGHTSVVYNNKIYVIGGCTNSGTLSSLNDVQYAPINADGTIGTWSAATSFTTARFSHASVVNNGYIYVIGGYGHINESQHAYCNDVQYATINLDGTIGSWNTTTEFPTPRCNFAGVAYNGYIYILGGLISGSYRTNDMQYAPFNADGTVGAWAALTSFTTVRCSFASTVCNGYLYISGGSSDSASLKDVQYFKFPD